MNERVIQFLCGEGKAAAAAGRNDVELFYRLQAQGLLDKYMEFSVIHNIVEIVAIMKDDAKIGKGDINDA